MRTRETLYCLSRWLDTFWKWPFVGDKAFGSRATIAAYGPAARNRPHGRLDSEARKGELMAVFDLRRRLAAEALGTAFLVAAVVGSGIMAERLTHDAALQFLCNTLPKGAVLAVLISVRGPISGAHFNRRSRWCLPREANWRVLRRSSTLLPR